MKKFIAIFLMVSSQLLCVPDMVWTSPSTISNTGVDASTPQVIVDANGNSSAVWIENGSLKSSFCPVNESWGAIVTVSASGCSDPILGVDSAGKVTALWLQTGVVSSATHPLNGSWSARTAISSTGASQPRLSADSAGNAVAVWTRNGFIESSSRLVDSIVPPANTWSLVSMLSSDGGASAPDVAISSNKTVIAVWNSNSSGQNNVYSAKGSLGGIWNSPISIVAVTPALHMNYPRVAIDANGNSEVVWFRYGQTGSSYYNVSVLAASLAANGTAWTAIPTILSDVFSQRNPASLLARVAFDTNGNAIALWTTSVNGQFFSIRSAVKPSGTNWVLGGEIVNGNSYALNGSLSTSALGDVVAAYMFFDASNLIIQSTETVIAGPLLNFYTSAQTISQDLNNGFPNISSTVSGSTINAAIVWLHSDGSNNRIQAVNGSRSVVLPPSNLGVIQNTTNFSVYSDYYNTISWTASPDTSVQTYNIYRNGIYLDTVSSFTATYDDHNAVQNGPVTYGVAAVNEDNSQSTIVQVSFP